jgi:hypothetical protein
MTNCIIDKPGNTNVNSMQGSLLCEVFRNVFCIRMTILNEACRKDIKKLFLKKNIFLASYTETNFVTEKALQFRILICSPTMLNPYILTR